MYGENGIPRFQRRQFKSYKWPHHSRLHRFTTPLFSRPTLASIAIESVRVQLFEQAVLGGPMFERTFGPQQDKRASIGWHIYATLKKRRFDFFFESGYPFRGSHLDHLVQWRPAIENNSINPFSNFYPVRETGRGAEPFNS